MSIDADEDDANLTDATSADAEGALNILLAFAQTNTAGYFLSLAAADPTLATLSRTNGTVNVALLASRGAAFKAGEATSAPTTAMPPQEIVVTLTLKRIDNLDSADTARLPGIAVAPAPATADLSNGLDRFASAFQAVFPALLLASGTGSSNSGQLWTVAASLLQPTISGKATDFAPAPLYTSLQSGAVAVPVYGDFGGDSWASVMTAYNKRRRSRRPLDDDGHGRGRPTGREHVVRRAADRRRHGTARDHDRR
ncbi:hypothetical protein [Azospirillum brasilense]|uniref:Uncharacterized protein n=1 Tax=Azospirillum brasilense TaxID=192 RepID=A0A6L3AYW7_AZOBR|nr:hypothetical protein [Azospirillum brasilense]KAA0684897.1 hypothetical protein DS837_15565 [Azospirillum brasilense]